MAQVRNISGEARSVPELGSFGGALVDVDEVVTVPDDRYAAFVSQGDVWESVTAPDSDAAIVDPSISPAPADDELGPIDVGDVAPVDLGGDDNQSDDEQPDDDDHDDDQQTGDAGQEGSN